MHNNFHYHVFGSLLNLFSRKDHQQDPDYCQYQQHNRRDGFVVAETHTGCWFCALGSSWQLYVKARGHFCLKKTHRNKGRAINSLRLWVWSDVLIYYLHLHWSGCLSPLHSNTHMVRTSKFPARNSESGRLQHICVEYEHRILGVR